MPYLTMDCAMTDNRFSWHRVGMVARFYYPRIKWQIVFYPLVVLILSLISNFIIRVHLPLLMTSPFSLTVAGLFYLGPLFLTLKSAREVETMLPATAKETATCLILYAVVVLPLIVIIPQFVSQLIMFGTLMPDPEIIDKMLPQNMKALTPTITAISHKSLFTNILSSLVLVLTTLCVVVRLKRQRIIMSIVFLFVANIVIGIICGAYGIVTGFVAGFSEAVSHSDNVNPEELAQSMLQTAMPRIAIGMFVVSAIVICILIPAIYRSIKNFQL